jgi:hypothetical protein
MSTTPATMQLRYLQTLTEISTEKSSTVIFPVPVDILGIFMRGEGRSDGQGGGGRSPVPVKEEGKEKS